jgi:hypothetical protein
MALEDKIELAKEMIRTGRCPSGIRDCTYCPVWNSVESRMHKDLGIDTQNYRADEGLRRWVRGWLALATGTAGLM